MKTILGSAVAAVALVGTAGAAQAQTHPILNPVNEQVTTTTTISTPVTQSWTNANQNNFTACPNQNANCWTGTKTVTTTTTAVETAFTINGFSYDDTTPAVDRIDVAFSLGGTVNRDCSFYAGNSSSARNIDFGVIGIRTGNNENVNSAFGMVGPAVANIETLTAGCNTNNVVEINKNDIRGLVNNNPGGYDTNEFQANIPYRVEARWTGVALNAQTTGTPQSAVVATNANATQVQQGAWRSNMEIDIVAPTVTDKGLVAGNYEGTTTVTLRAI